jgi:hypothetical protein
VLSGIIIFIITSMDSGHMARNRIGSAAANHPGATSHTPAETATMAAITLGCRHILSIFIVSSPVQAGALARYSTGITYYSL